MEREDTWIRMKFLFFCLKPNNIFVWRRNYKTFHAAAHSHHVFSLAVEVAIAFILIILCILFLYLIVLQIQNLINHSALFIISQSYLSGFIEDLLYLHVYSYFTFAIYDLLAVPTPMYI